MLDPWIIEEIRRRQDEERHRDRRPELHIPLDRPGYGDSDYREECEEAHEDEAERGVIVIDYRL